MVDRKLIYAEDFISSLRDDPLINGANFKRVVQHINDAPAVDVIVLPCKLGDVVYGQFHWYGNEIHECEVTRIKACKFRDGSLHYFLDVEFEIFDHYYNDGRMMRCQNQAVLGEDYGSWNRVYLTQKEAEIAKMDGGNEDG